MCYVCMLVGGLPKSTLEDLSSFISVVHMFLLCFTTCGEGGHHTYSRDNSLLYSVRPHSVQQLFLPVFSFLTDHRTHFLFLSKKSFLAAVLREA